MLEQVCNTTNIIVIFVTPLFLMQHKKHLTAYGIVYKHEVYTHMRAP